MICIATIQGLSYRASKEPREVKVVKSGPLDIDSISDTITVTEPLEVYAEVEVGSIASEMDVQVVR